MQTINSNALFIVDGSYLLYRSFYAIKPLYNTAGIPTQATFGFCRAIKKLLDVYSPRHIVIVWDSKAKTFRSELYEDYKATRQKPPTELFVQKEYIMQFLQSINMCHIAVDGYEADDIIAGLAREHGNNHQIVLVCPDKDMYQLLSDNLLIFDPFKDRLIDKKTFEIEQGFDVHKLSFYYALLGDASDNIPGVAGIGKKTAQELVVQFASLDDLYKHIQDVPKERTRKLLLDQKDNAFLSLKLFTLKPPPLKTEFSETAFNLESWEQAGPLFQELEFTSLLKGIAQKATSPLQHASLAQQTLFGQSQPSPQILPWKLVVVQDKQALDELIHKLRQAKEYALDTETTGKFALIDQLVGMSFAVDIHTAYYIPFIHNTTQPQLDRSETLNALREILEDPSRSIILHNAKFDQLVLWNNGIAIHPISFDTIIAANLVRNDWQKINLKDLSTQYLHEPMKKFKEILGKHKTFADVPLEIGAEYGAHDSVQTFKLKPLLEQALAKEPTLFKLFNEIDMPFYWVLTRMEQIGIALDSEVLITIGKNIDKELTTLENKIYACLETETTFDQKTFNINSPKQVERLLFDQLQLPTIKKSKTGQRSTDQDVLQELAQYHPVPTLIMQYRELFKLKNTYVEPLPTFINPKTKRIHTSYSQTHVATGRLSSSDPNLQNIPAAQGFGTQIRSAFIAEEGNILLSADYSQIELRILAHLSQDPTLIDIFIRDLDIHTQTSAQLFGISIDQVTSEQRQLGKRINFSIIYGMSPFGLARDLDIKQADAKIYIEKYFARYANVGNWMQKAVQEAIINGYSQTLYGRRRNIPELREKNRTLFEAGKRIAVNSPVQGTQADIMKIAMLNIEKALEKHSLKARMILQIHDEIIFELPFHEQQKLEALVLKEMEEVVSWKIPLKVSLRAGKNWAEITK